MSLHDKLKALILPHGYTLAHATESHGDEGSFGAILLVMRPKATERALVALQEAHNEDLHTARPGRTPHEIESGIWYRTGDDVMKILRAQALRLNPETEERRQKTRAEMTECFVEAGVGTIYVEEAPNEYHSDRDPYKEFEPWYVFTTAFGHVKVGWRRSVLVLDWSRTSLKARDPETIRRRKDYTDPVTTVLADELFPKADATKDKFWIHVWGYKALVEHLRVLQAHHVGATP